MRSNPASGPAFWTCAAFTLFSALVSAAFSLLSLHMAGGHEYALYAASRSVALPLAVLYALFLRSRQGVSALAVTMTLVQLFDAVVGFELHQPGRAYGPLVFAAVNLSLMLWMNRNTDRRSDYMLCRNRVQDLAAWHKVFRSHRAAQEDAGLHLRNMWASLGEPNNIFFLFQIDSVKTARQFIDDPRAAEAGKASGVLDGEYHFLTALPAIKDLPASRP
ncbi:hypothetical protein [Silvibacterium sp.]|uniref:hypothetical protein n=1 Tax=Silvibacterium sp. TaxID=1964179 RepID=UPI0039E33AC8